MVRRTRISYVPLARAGPLVLLVWLGLYEDMGSWPVRVRFAAADVINKRTVCRWNASLPSVRIVAKLSTRAWMTSRQVTARKMYTLALRSAEL